MSKADEIKECAVHLIALHGFESVSLRQMAKAVGIQAGSMYVHYRNKSELLQEIVLDYFDELVSMWFEHKRGVEGAAQLLDKYIWLYVNYHYSKPEESAIVRLDRRSLSPEGRGLVDELYLIYEAELEKILREGSCCGVFKVRDIGLTAAGIIALMSGTCAVYCVSDMLDKQLVGGLMTELVAGMVGR